MLINDIIFILLKYVTKPFPDKITRFCCAKTINLNAYKYGGIQITLRRLKMGLPTLDDLYIGIYQLLMYV